MPTNQNGYLVQTAVITKMLLRSAFVLLISLSWTFGQKPQTQRDRLDSLLDETTSLLATIHSSSPAERLQAALKKASQALELSRLEKSKAGEALSLFLIARLFEETNNDQRALKYYDQSLEVINSAQTTEPELKSAIVNAKTLTLKNKGRIQVRQGMYEDGLASLTEALALYNGLADDETKGTIERYIGECQRHLRIFPEAEQSYLKAQAIFDALGLQHNKGLVLNRLGLLYLERGGSLKEALAQFLAAEALLENSPSESELQQSRVWNLHYIATTYMRLNDFAAAEDYVQRVRSLRVSIRNPENLFLDYFIRGRDLKNDGKSAEALEVYREALEIAAGLDSKPMAIAKSKVWIEIAFIYYKDRKNDQGLKAIKQAMSFVSNLKDKVPLAEIFERVGDDAMKSRLFRHALDNYLKAILILRSDQDMSALMKYGEMTASLLQKAGAAQIETGDTSSALVNLRTSLAVQMSFGAKGDLADTLQYLMTSFSKLGKRRVGILFGKLAIQYMEDIRGSLKTLPVETQRAFLKGQRKIYETVITLLIEENRLEEAVQITNLYRDQEGLDLGDNRVTPLREIPLTQREQATIREFEVFNSRMKTFTDVINHIRAKIELRPPTEDEINQVNAAKRPLLELAAELDEKLKRIETEFTGVSDGADEVRNVKDVVELQKTLDELSAATGQKTIAIFTIVADKKFYGLLVTANSISAASSPIERDKLNDNARQLWALLGSADYDPRTLSNQLYRSIFKPNEEQLPKDTKTIMWSLDGNLRYLPMAALYDGRHYLVERYNNVVFTRSEKDRLTREVSPLWTGYGFVTSVPHKVRVEGQSFDFPPLDYAQDEMEIFRPDPVGTVEGTVFREAAFSKASLIAALTHKKPLVHISSHFRFNPDESSHSFLLLGDGQVMTLTEMKKYVNLFAGVELLTLSACDTAAQRAGANGREIDGFAELAQRSGASAVLASLWSVLDRSTAQLMREFYRNKQSGKYTKAEALRQSQLDLLYGRNKPAPFSNPTGSALALSKGGKTLDEEIFVEPKYRIPFRVDQKNPFAHPYYWSPFVLYGNWK